MRALVYTDINTLQLHHVPEPNPGPGEVKVRVRNCGICGSDVHGYLGKSGRRIPPMIMGHEFSGEVAALGEGITEPAVGTHVTVYPLLFCNQCAHCQSGRMNICPNKTFLGVLHTNGALTEYICVPKRFVIPISDAVPLEYAATIEPLAVGLHAVKQAGDLRGKSVLLIGAGTIGLMTLSFVLREHPAHVLISDVNTVRLEKAKAMGAIPVNPTQEDPGQVILRHTGFEQVDVVIEAVGSSATASQSVSLLKNGGIAVWVGNSSKIAEVPMQEIVTRELVIKGTHVYTFEEFAAVAHTLEHDALGLNLLISRICSLEEAPVYFERLAHNPDDLIKVVVAL